MTPVERVTPRVRLRVMVNGKRPDGKSLLNHLNHRRLA